MAETLVRSVKKALDSLDFVVKANIGGDGATLSEIAAELDEKLPTVRNILKTMEQCGYLARREKFYTPGPKCGDLRRGLLGRKLLAVMEPLLRKAAADTGESFVLTTILDGHREVLLRVQGDSDVVVNLKTADSSQPYGLITNKMMLAFADGEERKRFFEVNGSPGEAWPEWENDLAGLRDSGIGRNLTGTLAGFATAITDRSGVLLGAVGAYAPAYRADKAHERLLSETLCSIAEAAKNSF